MAGVLTDCDARRATAGEQSFRGQRLGVGLWDGLCAVGNVAIQQLIYRESCEAM